MMVKENSSILIVEDEIRIAEFVESYLTKSGYNVIKAFNGSEALEAFQQHQISLVLLDLMLPDISGEEVCRTIRKKSRIPIIMLTAKAEEEDVLKGLDIGADDYVTKPFSPRQLVARVGALLRRTTDENFNVSTLKSFNNGKLTIDTISREVAFEGQNVTLTPIEYKILCMMAKTPGRVFSRNDLIHYALGEDYDGYDRTIDSHIKNLRQKIESNTKNCEFIITVHGTGYKFGGQ